MSQATDEKRAVDGVTTNRARARLLPMFPLSVVQGGLELQCVRTQAALESLGLDATLLDYYRTDEDYDILHLFGGSPNFYDLCLHSQGRRHVVVTAVTSARSASVVRKLIWDGASALASAVRSQTVHDRIKAVFNMASAVICLNSLESDFVRVTYEVPESRLHIIPTGINEACYDATPDLFEHTYGIRNFVLFTGHMVPRKNPLLLAEALRDMNVPGVFIGGTLPSEQAYADRLAEVVDRTPNLLWIKQLSHEDPLLPSAYAAAAALCLPSSAEVQSASALEAMAAGKPVVLADLPYAHQTPFEHAVKCSLDGPALRRCLEAVLAQPERYSHRLSDAYRWRNVAQAIANVYDAVLTGHD